MLRPFFLSAVTKTVAMSLDMPLPFVSPPRLRGLRFRCRLPLSDLSNNVSLLSAIPKNEPPSSCFRERNILYRQSKAVFLLMCNAADILSSDFCPDISCMYAFTSHFLWSFCCHVPVYSVKVLLQSLHGPCRNGRSGRRRNEGSSHAFPTGLTGTSFPRQSLHTHCPHSIPPPLNAVQALIKTVRLTIFHYKL